MCNGYLRFVTCIFIFSVVAACSSNTDEVVILEPEEVTPNITSITPRKGIVGTLVTISGDNFDTNPDNVTVKFNNTVADEVFFSSEVQISTKVPENAMTGPISVTIKSLTGISNTDFEVEETDPVPLINEVIPSSALVSSEISLVGSGFGLSANEVAVYFNGVNANEVKLISDTLLQVVVPVDAGSGTISLEKDFQIALGPSFVVETPSDFKVAFIGDTHIGSGADAVLQIIKEEGVQVVVHPGDLNYDEIPLEFEENIKTHLGEDFPYFYSVGNHDDTVWKGTSGYQALQESRFNRLGISWKGDLGELSSFYYQGIYFVTSAPDEFGITTTQAGEHVREALSRSHSIWNIAFWHKNQRLMQIGGKRNEAGWPVYEESRRGGAIIATGHEHSYSRTYEMSNFETQTISQTSNTINLIPDDPSTDQLDEGRSFAFVSGLGGSSIRDAENGLDKNSWWASVYHSDNGGQFGTLIGEYNYRGDPSLARFYFIDIDRVIHDEFFVRSKN